MSTGRTEASNRIKLTDIHAMQIGEIANLHVSELACLIEDADEMAKTAKKYKDWISGAVAIKYADADKEARKDGDKATGTIHIADEGFDIESAVKKTVEWDSARLADALDTMAREDAKHYCKVTLEVDERNFNAAPPAIQALLMPHSKPAYKIVAAKGAV